MLEELVERLTEIEAKHESLARRCLWLQGSVAAAVTLALALCAAVLAMMAPGSKPPAAPWPSVVDSERFVLRDKNGKERAVLEITQGGQPRLRFVGNQKASVVLGFQSVDSDFPVLRLDDRDGHKRLSLGVAKDGSSISLFKRDQVSAVAELSQSEAGGGSLVLTSGPSRGRFQATLLADGTPEVHIVGQDGGVAVDLAHPKSLER